MSIAAIQCRSAETLRRHAANHSPARRQSTCRSTHRLISVRRRAKAIVKARDSASAGLNQRRPQYNDAGVPLGWTLPRGSF